MKSTTRLAAVGALALSATTASASLVKVVLLGGQSNAVGQGNNAGLPTSPVNLQLPQDDVLFYYTGGTGLTTLRPGSGGHPVATGGKFGVEVTFGREIADADPSVTYAIIKHAESGTALYNDWALATGPSYAGFRNTVAAGLAALQSAGYTTEIVGMLWHQGESDALEGQQNNYANNLMAFIADIRSRYGANLPFFIGEIRHNGPAYMTVVNAQVAVAAADPNARFVPATDLSFYDFFHFDAAGLVTLGERFATAFLDLIPSEPANPVTIDSAFSGSFTAVNSAADSAYEGHQSASDLLNGLPATVATGWNTANGSTVPELNDGIHGAFPGSNVDGTWTDEAAVVEYDLGPNAEGYDISSIQAIASWTDSGFGNQVWTVEVKPVGGSYVLLATVDYTPFNNTSGGTKVNLNGLDASGIESIRFTAGSTAGKSAGNDFVIREIDVEGTPTSPSFDVTIASGFSGSYTTVNSPSDAAYEGDQSASDLLNGVSATVATGWNAANGSTVPELNDGIHGGFSGGNVDGTWTDEAAVVEYNLGANAEGYDISSIQTIASWTDSGFGNQVWTVEVKPVGGSYTLLATVDYTPFNNAGGATKVNLTGLDATGIESIRFTAGSTAGNSFGNDFVIREIDVEGTAVPSASNVTIESGFSGSFTAVSSGMDSAYEGDQSASDLLNGLTASVATGWNTGSGSTVAELNDGIHGAAPGGDAEGTWSDEGAVAEYVLGANPQGYDISTIQAIASWTSAGFGNQVWTVEVKPVGGSYVLLATVDFTPFNNTGGATKVNLTGLDATGIESIRFTAGSTAGNSFGNDFVFREIDVEGIAVPSASNVTIESGFSGSFTEVSSATDSAYEGDQSGSDLLNGLTATVATGWNLTNGSSVPELNDGIHGGFPGGDAEGTWSNEGATAEYVLGASAAGYDITSIQAIASWDGSGFGNQVWTVEVKPVGGSYTLLATVDSTPFNNSGGATKVNLTGLDAIGIESIRFTAGSTAGNSSGNDFVFREIDVEGSATPIPAVVIDAGFSGAYTAVSSATDSAYEGDQSASDLLNGLTATVATGWNTGSGSTVPELNDGIHGGSPGGNAEGTWSNEGAIAEYVLGANALGYDLSSIQAIASWGNAGFGNQVWTVEVKPVGGSYTHLATVNYTPFNNTGGATKINLTGLDATGIESIRFTAGSTGGNSVGNDFVFREIDVFGAAAQVAIESGFSGTYSAASSTTASAYEGEQSGTDLLNGLTATVATGWNTGSGSTVPELNDGIHGAFHGGDAEGTWSNEGAISEYVLGSNARGYDITSIQAIASWADSGFGNQVWTVEVKPVGGSYTLLATVEFTPFNNTGGATKINLDRLDATGIESIRFTAGSTAGNSYGNDFVFREIDVFGSATPEPLRILCVGDSLTAGYTDNPNWTHPFEFGYRSGLYTRLTNAGYNFQFVGASTHPWDGSSGDPTHGGTYTPSLDLRDFGQDGHRGFGGQGIWGSIDGFIAADNPDVILLMIGINDLHAGSQAALSNLVDSIVTTAPDVHLIVAQTSPFATFDQTLYDYNVYIRDTLVPSFAANGKKVSTVDCYTPFLVDPNNYASDIKSGVMANNYNHPVNSYYDLMAQEWYEGLQALGVGPANAAFISASQSVFGSVSGTLENADVNDGLYHTVIEEVVDGTSILEHEWGFHVLPGSTVTFYVEAHHTANGEGDDFVFAYSTDGVVYDEMLMVTKTEDNDTVQFFTFPEAVSGPITVMVQDTDETMGNTQLDSILIDAMFIVSE